MKSSSLGRGAGVMLAIVAALVFPVHVQAQSSFPPESARAVAAVFADIEATAPGCAVGVVADQRLVYAEGFGLANLDYGLPITPRSVFYLGSIGKQFTAAVVAHAERAGHLSLDDRITKWLPEVPEYERPITIRHLLHHTSGLRDYLGLWTLAGRELEGVYTDDEVLRLIARQRNPNFPAGDEYLYSNTGYFLLGVIIERATGMSLRAYTQQEILDPLGMTRTRVHDDRGAVIPDRVVGYEAASGGYRLSHPWNFDKVGSGGVYSSIEDLVHWDRNYYTEEVGGPGFTERLRVRGELTDGSTIPYAMGLLHGRYRGLTTIGHGGALAGFRSQILRFPGERTTILVLCNFSTSDPGGRARRVADVVLADRLGGVEAAVEEEPAEDTAPVELTPAQLDAFTGHWRASNGIEVEIRREDAGLLFLQRGTRSPLAVVSDSALRLESADIDMALSDRADGKYRSMVVVQRGRSFTAERFEPAGDQDHSSLVGEYYSQELDATYRLVEGSDGLMLEVSPARTSPVYILDQDRVRTPNMILHLDRANGQVVGFTVETGRVRGIRFERLRDG